MHQLSCNRAARRAVLGLSALLGIVATPTHAQQPAPSTCAVAYHAGLDELRTQRGDNLSQAVTVLKAADAALPGRWLYAQSLFPNAKKPRVVEPERVCAEQIRISGRMRCTRYEPVAVAALPGELTISPAPTSNDTPLTA